MSNTMNRWCAGMAIALGVGCGLVLSTQTLQHDPVVAEIVTPAPTVAPFTLSGPQGGFSESDLTGGWDLVFSGYTHCPDVCPTTLAQLAAAVKQAKPTPRIVFATMDPLRDTRERMAAYAAYFGNNVVPLTGSQEALGVFSAAFGFIQPGRASPFDEDVIAHSPTVVVVDPRGRIAARVREPTTENITLTLNQLRSRP